MDMLFGPEIEKGSRIGHAPHAAWPAPFAHDDPLTLEAREDAMD
jgi:hypothetical protein